MEMTITPQGIVLAGSVLTAVTAIAAFLVKLIRWVDRQKQQDEELKTLEKNHNRDIGVIQHEQTLAIYGILAALKGLKEQGCNGPVTEAIGKIEKYLNQKAHGEI